jgi:integrase
VEPPADVDVVHLLAEAEEVDLRLALFLQLAIVTGARRGALCALRSRRRAQAGAGVGPFHPA